VSSPSWLGDGLASFDPEERAGADAEPRVVGTIETLDLTATRRVGRDAGSGMGMDFVMDTRDEIAGIRTLRAKGFSPKDIARALGVPPATAARLVRAVATEQNADPAEREVLECWVSPGWSVGLNINGHLEWPDLPRTDPGAAGLVAVLVARDAGRSRVSLCGYLVDVYCLGVKDAVGPRAMNTNQAAEFTRSYYGGYQDPPLAAPLELAQNLVYGAIEYARSLGRLDPAPDFEATRDHLGPWSARSAISFGRDGKPFFIQGPRDNAARVVSKLQRSVGPHNFEFLIAG